MILKKLIMHNFGVYAGDNVFTFSGIKPVVLIGGMNGRGKTTFLEAVLLGLYGSNSFAYTESRFKTYGKYLRSYVNRADGTLSSFVDLEFTMDGSEEETYYVHREWNAKGSKVREKVLVKKNNQESAFLTENWPMFVENILPSALSSFFFFDGEKIAELAVESTNQKMKESIKALLGINVLDLLDNDLGRIITRLSNQNSEDQNLKYLEELRHSKDIASDQLASIDGEIEREEAKLDHLRSELEKKKIEYEIKGGEIVEQRHDLMRQRSEAVASVEHHQELLLELAAGAIPLMVVKDLINDIQIQGDLEQSYRMSQLATQKVNDLYEKFIIKYPNARDEIQRFIQYIEDENELQQGEEIYGIAESTLYQITALNNGGLISEKEKILSHITRRDECQKKIDDYDSYLSVDIDEKALNRIFRQMKTIEKEITTVEVGLEDLSRKRSSLHGAFIVAESEFSKATEQVLASLETTDDENRTVKYAHMAIEIVKQYRFRIQQSKADLLAETMTACYKQLANKKNLIDRVIMDSDTLDLHYLNSELEEVEKKTLSAGEKQLMVISLLWALAICSKKKLPVIIDTPLSRLDSSHREALITTYFPNASDQTIILSTDSEIDEKYYSLMKQNVQDEFTLVYDDEKKKTTIQRGYLFNGRR